MVTDTERERLCTLLRDSARQFHEALAGIGEAEWNHTPGPVAWSIAGIAEHVVVTERNVLERVQTTLLESPPSSPELRAKAPSKERILVERLPERTSRIQAPPSAHPTGRWSSPADALAAFDEVRGRTLAYAMSTTDDLRGHFLTHAALKEMDGYHWLMFLAAHTSRHVAQMEEVKSSAGYPTHA